MTRAPIDSTRRSPRFGVACEACHGPGGDHVRRHANPFERYEAHRRDGTDSSIVDPARLSAERSAMVCGQCHAYTYPADEDEWWLRGTTRTFRPGQDLAPARVLLTPSSLREPGSPRDRRRGREPVLARR